VTYARVWRGSCAVLTTVSLGLAALQWSPGIVLLAVTVSSGTAVAVLAINGWRWARPAPGSGGLVNTLERSLWAGSGTVALCALTGSSPPIALLVVVLLVLTSPPVIRLVCRQARQEPPVSPQVSPQFSADAPTRPAAPASDPDASSPGDILALDDDQVCRLWRRTFWELQSEPTVDERLRLVAVRQWCLDELDRRNTAALHAWLSSGARAAGGPERFWHDPPPPQDADTA
jgi:hypothetical protein